MDQMGSPTFEFSTRVRYSETMHDELMSLPALIDIFQDCSIFHSEAIGFGPKRLKEEKKAWVLTHWHIVVERYPHLGEEVTVGTFPSGFKTVSAKRSFYLRDDAGSIIARANSTWGFIDLSTGKPVRPSPDHVAAYGLREPLEMPAEARKIALPEMLEPCDPITVRRDLIDTNEHVNNSQYVRIALGVLPAEVRPDRVRVDYKRSAVLGDVLHPQLALEESRSVVALTDAEGAAYGAVEFLFDEPMPIARSEAPLQGA